jgi:hypothetical protein
MTIKIDPKWIEKLQKDYLKTIQDVKCDVIFTEENVKELKLEKEEKNNE